MKRKTKSKKLALHSIRVLGKDGGDLSSILNAGFTYFNEILHLAEKGGGRYCFREADLFRRPPRTYMGEIFDVCYALPEELPRFERPPRHPVYIPFKEWLRLGKPMSLVYRNCNCYIPSSKPVKPFQDR